MYCVDLRCVFAMFTICHFITSCAPYAFIDNCNVQKYLNRKLAQLNTSLFKGQPVLCMNGKSGQVGFNIAVIPVREVPLAQAEYAQPSASVQYVMADVASAPPTYSSMHETANSDTQYKHN